MTTFQQAWDNAVKSSSPCGEVPLSILDDMNDNKYVWATDGQSRSGKDNLAFAILCAQLAIDKEAGASWEATQGFKEAYLNPSNKEKWHRTTGDPNWKVTRLAMADQLKRIVATANKDLLQNYYDQTKKDEVIVDHRGGRIFVCSDTDYCEARRAEGHQGKDGG